jgi:hypothetical protein
MIGQIRKFRESLDKRGLKTAVSETYDYLTPHDYIRERLLATGPATIPHAIYVHLYRPVLERRIGSGINVMEQDWDNLIILDACRADYLREHSTIDGEMSTVVSKGSWSGDFAVKNFQDGNYHDTIVITANPHYHRRAHIEEDKFFKLNYVEAEDDNGRPGPRQVTEAAISEIENHPKKRAIIHYMQPHAPHVGETADRFREPFENESFQGHLMFRLFKSGVISKETLKQSYIDSIGVIEKEIKEGLLEQLSGKTVVTADHGENLGEVQHGIVQLKHGNPTPECRYVPWLELDYDERREIVEDEPIGFDTATEEAIKQRLEVLGYK